MWQPQATALSDSFRTIATDLPAHGVLANVPFHMQDVVRRLSQLLDREARGPAILAGISLGGYVAMEFAAQHPQRVAGLVLLSCTAEPTGVGAALYWLATWVMSAGPRPLLRAVKHQIFRVLLPPDRAALVTGDYFRGGAQGIRQVLWNSYIKKVRRFAGPVLFINGRRDLPFRSSERRFLAAAPEARLELIPRAYHACNLDDPLGVTAAIRRFATSIPSFR
jgi:pimeloyl-ACP methyl ester carboxylesterase